MALTEILVKKSKEIMGDQPCAHHGCIDHATHLCEWCGGHLPTQDFGVESAICKKVAQLFAFRDWHKLSSREREIVADLERAGWIKSESTPGGFVGKAIAR